MDSEELAEVLEKATLDDDDDDEGDDEDGKKKKKKKTKKVPMSVLMPMSRVQCTATAINISRYLYFITFYYF